MHYFYFSNIFSKTAQLSSNIQRHLQLRGLSLFLLRWVWVKEVRPIPEIKSNEYCWQQNQGSLVNDSDQFRLGVRVQEEDCTELHQLQEDEDDAGDHPHVQAGHVGHARD